MARSIGKLQQPNVGPQADSLVGLDLHRGSPAGRPIQEGLDISGIGRIVVVYIICTTAAPAAAHLIVPYWA